MPYSWAASNAGAMLNAGILTYLHPIDGAGHGLPGQYRSLIDVRLLLLSRDGPRER